MIVLLFQIHRQLINDNIGKFVPLVMQTLGITITQPDISFPAHLHGIDVLNHTSSLQTAYADYISAQVKTLSFLAYISRCYANLIRPHFPLIPINVIRLLNSCPPDSASARKVFLFILFQPLFLRNFWWQLGIFFPRKSGSALFLILASCLMKRFSSETDTPATMCCDRWH